MSASAIMPNIFISYQRQVQAFVDTLATDIIDLGHTVWFDQVLSGGQVWWEQILDEIRKCDVFAFVLTQAALDSQACLREYDYADKLGKPILPIMAMEVMSTSLLPPALIQIQYVDYTERNIEAVKRLSRAFTTAPPAKPLPNPLPTPPEAPISPLVRLNQQIEKPDLSREEQSYLVIELKRLMRSDETAADARLLLEKFSRHDDLRANLAQEMREILESPAGSVDPKPEPLQVSDQTDLPQTFKNSLNMEFVLIPAGEFQMGANDGRDNERPIHQVRISQSFYLAKHLVTQAQWQAMMGNNPSNFKGGNHPVETVSWDNAQEFIQKLNEKEGKNSYRLPTEAEWEYAARAGSTAKYTFGDDESRLAEYAWYEKNSYSGTHPVGQLKPNDWGLYDMHGNVWEWVQDWHAEYTEESVTDPQGPSSGSGRVIRGGGWSGGARNCRFTYRGDIKPSYHHYGLGFRLLRTAM